MRTQFYEENRNYKTKEIINLNEYDIAIAN